MNILEKKFKYMGVLIITILFKISEGVKTVLEDDKNMNRNNI